MIERRAEFAVVAGGVGYLVLLVAAMNRVSFDIWGALFLLPIYGVLGVWIIARLFPGPHDGVRRALMWGLAIKTGGAFARYWVGFEAYEGGIDAGAYHAFARERAGEIWSGERSIFAAIPTRTGTAFAEDFTGLVYTFTGGSKFAGFITFSFLAYIGIVLFVRAAMTALPGMASVKYAWLCAVAPSLVYWPSSIGKEAIVIFGLGLGTLGIARLLTGERRISALLITAAGLGFTAMIRPHMTGIWIAAALPALVTATLLARRRTESRLSGRGRLGLIAIIVGATAGLAAIASITVRFLQPRAGGDATITELFAETTRRTAQAGSQFTPPSVDSPLQWPWAIVRTLIRPLPIEAVGIAQLMSAAEIVLLAGLYLWSWRRVRQVFRSVLTDPYVLFVVGALALTGLAFASFANLGVLTRQKSLAFPFLLLLPCLPLTRAATPAPRREDHHADFDEPESGAWQPGAWRADELAPDEHQTAAGARGTW